MEKKKAMRPKQKKLQSQMRILERRKKVSELYLRRYTMLQISELLNTCLKTISNDIIAIKKEWQEEAKDSIAEVISRELAEIQHLENEAAKQFIRQRDKAFLELRLKCKDRRAKLLGLDAPEKHEDKLEVSGGLDLSLLTDEELDVIQGILERHE